MQKVVLKLESVELSRVDSTLDIYDESGKLGRLQISKGGVDWIPKSKSVNSRTYSWAEFAEVLSENGRKKKVARKNDK